MADDELRVAPLADKKFPPSAGAPTKHVASPEPRRDFLSKAAAVVTGGAITACPVAAGVAVLVDPLTRSAGEAKAIRVTSLAALPDDGVPRQFPVIVETRDDAWTRFVDEPIGAVFLLRKPGSSEVQAWNATCTHAGCFVGYVADRKEYYCPCHNSAFAIDGAVISGPPPRPMDTLKCEVKGNDVLVYFQDYYTGKTAKEPKL